MIKVVGVAAFRATCPRIIKQMKEDGESVVVTKHGRPVAIVSPVPADFAADVLEAEYPCEEGAPYEEDMAVSRGSADSNRDLVIGAMRGSVLRYDEPCEPAADRADWSALG